MSAILEDENVVKTFSQFVNIIAAGARKVRDDRWIVVLGKMRRRGQTLDKDSMGLMTKKGMTRGGRR